MKISSHDFSALARYFHDEKETIKLCNLGDVSLKFNSAPAAAALIHTSYKHVPREF